MFLAKERGWRMAFHPSHHLSTTWTKKSGYIVFKVQDSLQDAAANGPGFIRNGEAVVPLTPGVDIAGFLACSHLKTIVENTPQHAADLRPQGNTVNCSHRFPRLYRVADCLAALEDTCCRCSQDPFFPVAHDLTGDAGIGRRRPLPDYPAQVVAALGFNDRMGVRAGGKAGTEGNDNGSLVDARPKVGLGQDGVDNYPGLQGGNNLRPGVHQDGNLPLPGYPQGTFRIGNQAGGDPFDRYFPAIYSFRECHSPANYRRPGDLCHDHLKAGLVQAVGHPAGQVAGPFNNY
ncbi:sugar (pentulose and hexulose) kinases [Moorella thermoacetica Y72]|uniref:Sugar (Pentulose and hexulose) kinases n=1 Tax=Moorella thermoacetica Y72 TaxID=1325331 RepID=A0A0S6UBA4_NEOTH|nr:sugar (pentulose and hexulose) kinases [Moorella thermoacetica Y72]